MNSLRKSSQSTLQLNNSNSDIQSYLNTLKTSNQNENNHFCTTESLLRSYNSSARNTTTTNNNNNNNVLKSASETNLQSNENFHTTNNSLIICENYPPSYLSRKEQIGTIKDEIKRLRESKELLKQTMKQIDAALEGFEDRQPIIKEEKRPKYGNRYLLVTPCKDKLPTHSIKRPVKSSLAEKRKYQPWSSSIFEPFSPSTFTDKIILQHRKNVTSAKKKEEPKKPLEDPLEPRLS